MGMMGAGASLGNAEMSKSRIPVKQLPLDDLVEMLRKFAGEPPPRGQSQDDWDAWLVAAVLRRCQREEGKLESGLADALRLLRRLPAFPQMLPHFEHQLGRTISDDELKALK
jgi:hypothetical protein